MSQRTRNNKGSTRYCERCMRKIGSSGWASHRASKACRNRASAGAATGAFLTETHYEDEQDYDPLDARTREQPSSSEPQAMYNPIDASPVPPTPRVLSTPLPSDQTLRSDSPVADPYPPSAQDPVQESADGSASGTAEQQLGRLPQIDDIKIEPHPHNGAGKRTRYCAYEDYTTDLPQPKQSHPLSTALREELGIPLGDVMPWTPFSTRVDFEFAQLMQSAQLKSSEVDNFIAIVRKILAAPEDFTLKDGKQVRDTWASATRRYGHGMEQVDITARYKDEKIVFPLWRVKAWDWCKSLLDNPELYTEFRWDAEQLFRHNGEEFERFINEPWTAKRWWEIQCQLPQRNGQPAVPFCIIFYADKTKLSTMGTKKGYPVYVRCANLPAHIRNGEGIGGGFVVGLLPIVDEDNDKSGKKSFVDFKRVVWHACISEILESLRQYAEFGYQFECSDGITRWLYPVILMLSADFEEQCVMAAIRGYGSSFPCPVCLAPAEAYPALGGEHELRTPEAMKKIYDAGESAATAAEREEMLKAAGLRRVANAFWSLRFTNVYRAISWDRLHAYHSGLFRKHILQEFLNILETFGEDGRARRALSSLFEKYLRQFPRWRDLAHFNLISEFNEYSDGRKYEDLGKIIVFAAHSLFTPSNEREYQWLALARSYLELDMWSSLRNQRARAIRKGREELQRFKVEAEKYSRIHPAKQFNFPKAHSHAHMFDDIEDKGVTLNFNTKFNEKKHGGQKDKFDMSNFKEVEKHIARLTHEELAASIMQQNIELYDLRKQRDVRAPPESPPEDLSQPLDIPPARATETRRWISVGSRSRIPLSSAVDDVEGSYKDAFINLRRKLIQRVQFDSGVTGGWTLSESAMVTQYKFIKVDYTSFEDSQTATDFLRVNPSFHGRPRYDCALINAVDGKYLIGRIVSVLGVEDQEGVERQYALIIPFDLRLSRSSQHRVNLKRAAHLRFKQLRSRKASDSIVVPVESIVRGALMVPDWGCPDRDQYIVMDAVDADFFLRMRLDGLGDLLVSDTVL